MADMYTTEVAANDLFLVAIAALNLAWEKLDRYQGAPELTAHYEKVRTAARRVEAAVCKSSTIKVV